MRKKHKFGILLLFVLFFSLVFPKFTTFDFISSKNIGQVSFARSPIKSFDSPEHSYSQSSFLEKKDYIILFKSKEYSNTFADKPFIQVIHQYHSFPLLYVRMSETQKNYLGSLSQVEAIVPNKEIKLPTFSQKNSNCSHNIRPTSLSSCESINADAFWDHGYNGSDTTIAVIDTGISHHKEFKDRIVAERSFVKEEYGYNKSLGPTEDLHPHGTMVAGVAAGKGKEIMGQGVAPKASLINARVFPGGEHPHATLAAILAAIEWSVKQNTDVINLSLGAGTSWYSTPSMATVNEAVRKGVTVVVAAGNSGSSGTWSMSIGSFGSSKNVITVGATANGKTNSIATLYSSIGPTVKAAVKPDIAAPSGVFSTTLGDDYTSYPVRGTSFSAPHVAGAAALLTEFLNEKNITNKQPSIIKSSLMKTADPIVKSGSRYSELYAGKGSMNLKNTFQFLSSHSISPDILTVSPSTIPQGLKNTTTPFYPYAGTLFKGERLAFNFTFTSTYNSMVSVSFDGNFTSALNISSSESFKITYPTSLWEFKSNVRKVESGFYQGFIHFSTDVETINVSIAFQLENPSGCVLWDMKHTSWMSDFIYGQYRHLYQRFVQLDIAVDMWRFHSSQKAAEILDPAQYDLVFMPDTASYPPPWTIDKGVLDYDATLFSKEEITAFYNYVEQGGDLCIVAMGNRSNNFTNLNMLTKQFGIEYTGKMTNNEHQLKITSEMHGHILSKGVENISFSGSHLSTTHSLVLPLSRYRGKPVMAYSKMLNGSVFASATNFMFDNKRFEVDTYKESSSNLVQNLLKVAQEGKTYLSDFEVSPSNLKLEETVNVSFTASKSIDKVVGVASDFLGLTRFPLISEDTIYHGSFQQKRIAGNIWVGVNLTLSSGWTFVFSKDAITVSYGSNPPTITGEIVSSGYSNGSVQNWEYSPLQCQFLIKDDKQLNYSGIYTKLLTLNSNVPLSYNLKQLNKTSWLVNITLSTETLRKTMVSFCGHLRINVSTLDLASNSARNYLTIQLKDPSTPSLTILSPTSGQIYSEDTISIDAKWNASDKESGIKLFKAKLDQRIPKDVSPEKNITDTKLFSLTPGKHQLSITAINHMNKTRTKSVIFYIGEPKNPSYSFSLQWIIGGVIVIGVGIVLGFYIYKKRKS